MKPTSITVELEQGKVTKNMIRFEAPGGENAQRGATVPNLYVRQSALSGAFAKFPRRVRITIEEVE